MVNLVHPNFNFLNEFGFQCLFFFEFITFSGAFLTFWAFEDCVVLKHGLIHGV